MLTVKLPEKKLTNEYSLYVNSKIRYLMKDKKNGTLIQCEGCGVAFYSSRNSRRAYIFSDNTNNIKEIPLQEGNLPYFKERVSILYRAKGKKIDILKHICYKLEEKYGKEIYELGNIYWLMLGAYIDSLGKSETKKTNRLIFQITDKYLKKKQRKKDKG